MDNFFDFEREGREKHARLMQRAREHQRSRQVTSASAAPQFKTMTRLRSVLTALIDLVVK